MFVADYSAWLPGPQTGCRGSGELWIIAAFSLGGVLLSLVAAIYEPGLVQAVADSYTCLT